MRWVRVIPTRALGVYGNPRSATTRSDFEHPSATNGALLPRSSLWRHGSDAHRRKYWDLDPRFFTVTLERDLRSNPAPARRRVTEVASRRRGAYFTKPA